MSDNNASAATVDVYVPAENKLPSFLTDTIDLKRLLKNVASHSKPAIEALVACLASKDEKIRLTAASKLLEFQVQIAKEINADQMQRLIAEVKLSGRAGSKTTTDLVPEDRRPIVDFTTIREIE